MGTKLKIFLNRLTGADALLLLACLLFWVLRFRYWGSHSEAPFSDMLGYVKTAENIRSHFFFGLSPADPTFYTPVTPSIIALSMLIDMQHYESVFRLIVQAVAFCGALWLARELFYLTGKKWLGASLVLIVAVCRPSIFWSLKLATEPVGEALLYVTAAMALATLRTRNLFLALVCGVTALLLGLNRPNFLPGAMFIPLAFLLDGFLSTASATNTSKTIARDNGKLPRLPAKAYARSRPILLLVVFCVGFFGTWGCWIGRNWINYGVVVPTSSTGLQSFNWEYGGNPIRIGRYSALQLSDGTEVSKFGLNEIRTGTAFVDRDKKLAMITKAWLRANLADLPRLLVWRLNHLVASRGANGLTTLSREDLFEPTLSPKFTYPNPQVSWVNLLLLDKAPTICFVALVGVCIFFYRFRAAGMIFFGLALIPWIAAAAVLGWERIVESSIALTIWFAFFCVAELVSRLEKSEDVARSAAST